MNQMQENEAGIGSQQSLKLGGMLAIVGGLGYLATLLVHGNLPDQTTEVALEHIAGRPEWRVLKLALILFALCWVGSFHTLVRTLPEGLSASLGRWAVSIATVGVAIVVVEYAIIGHALKGIADAWVAASTADAEVHVRMADVMLAITGGLFHSFIAYMIGLPFMLLGIAIGLGRGYPRWMGWVAAAAGFGAFVSGTTRFVGIELVPFPLLYGGFILPLCVWLSAIGVLMWRGARKPLEWTSRSVVSS